MKKREKKEKKEIVSVPKVNVKKEIPMYDPQTGEPNYEYENLTGKKNPLIELRKSETNLFPKNIELKLNNRWVARVQDIEPFLIRSADKPIALVKERKFLGFTFYPNIEWGPMSIDFYDSISISTTQKLMALLKSNEMFDYVLEELDPTGLVIEKWVMRDCVITYLNFGNLDYNDNNLGVCSMVVSPSDVILIPKEKL
jgi:hypothetical protein